MQHDGNDANHLHGHGAHPPGTPGRGPADYRPPQGRSAGSNGSRRRLRLLAWLAFPLVVFASCGYLVSKLGSLGQTELAEHQLLKLTLSSQWRESPNDELAGLEGLLGGGSMTSVHELRDTLAAAAKDPRIDGVLIVGAPLQTGFGAIAEARHAIEQFQQSKKPITSVWPLDGIGEKELLLATATDHITVSPHALFAFDGLAAEVGFYRGLLDKLQIRPEFIQYHEYKSAAEPFMRSDMSPQFRESLGLVLNTIWQQTLKSVAEDRKLEVDKLRTFADEGLTTVEAAKELGLVDLVGYPDQAVSELRKRASPRSQAPEEGETGEASPPSQQELPFITANKYNEVRKLERVPFNESPVIAVVYGEGPIISGKNSGLSDGSFSGPTVAANIRKAAADERVRGIVLRIDSPGGAVVGSDLVWREVQRTRTIHNKPVVVSMGSVAASGGYWVSMGANEIIAEPTTITGSIGVVFGKFYLSGLGDMVGVHHELMQEGQYADVLSSFRPLEGEREAIIRRWMDDAYGGFVRRVAKGRSKELSVIEGLAKGRIWSGNHALEHGLVDHLGGVGTAVDRCRELSGLATDAEFELLAFPEQKSLLESLMELNGQGEADIVAAPAVEAPGNAELARKLALARDAGLVDHATLELLARLQRPGVWALSPALEIK